MVTERPSSPSRSLFQERSYEHYGIHLVIQRRPDLLCENLALDGCIIRGHSAVGAPLTNRGSYAHDTGMRGRRSTNTLIRPTPGHAQGGF